ncbi:MAG: 3-hydroxybutyryl-CoA dehydrogenase [Holophaga sp.]|nr:3-hydroxybutyryl-CoA dehydrogenase [Holophaga sp.]
MNIHTIGVVGTGHMGCGIAHVFAAAGFQVILQDLSHDSLGKALASIEHSLQRGVEKGKLGTLEMANALGRIRTTTSFGDFKEADFVVEAGPEHWETKKQFFETLDLLCRPDIILATSTGISSITRLGSLTKRPECVIGMHFLHPVPAMPLVEVVRGLATSDATCATVSALAKRLDKTPVPCNDSPGFVSNRLLMPMINEAIFALEDGVAEVQSIDTIMKLGMNHPMGPLALADLLGLDVCLASLQMLHEGFGDPKYRPCPLLGRYVAAGWLGKKAGRGFYEY